MFCLIFPKNEAVDRGMLHHFNTIQMEMFSPRTIKKSYIYLFSALILLFSIYYCDYFVN
jgi:hypothetical protein